MVRKSIICHSLGKREFSRYQSGSLCLAEDDKTEKELRKVRHFYHRKYFS